MRALNKVNNKERHIANKAVRQFEAETGYHTILHFYENANTPNKEDAILTIINEDYQVEFKAEIKVFINRARLGLVQNQLRLLKGRTLLITEYVNPELMKTMEDNGINFIDTTGNAFIKVPPLFIKVKGNKLDKKNKVRTQGRTFNAAALQVIFALLCNPGINYKTIRVIEENAGTATGTVYNTIQQLIKQGYMHDGNYQRYRLKNKEELLQLWVTLYPEKLRPKYLIDRYEIDINLLNNLEPENYRALWGGEKAAATLTNYLQPFFYTIYLDEKNKGEFVLKNRLKKNPRGKLELLKKFWNFENYDYPDITHPILVYADLLATGDPRNIETAQIIYEKDVVRYIKED